MTALYNELDAGAAAWLRVLIAQGHIAHGDVDGRSVVDVRPADLAGRGQVHLFAGIGVWSYAARLAGWPDDRPLWTASCPCQPFSTAGKRKGTSDERHLWPIVANLVRECRPPVIVGEQVASPDGLGWLDALFADLEGAGYACWATDSCAAGVGAPHIRQRLYWCAIRLANCAGQRWDWRQNSSGEAGRYCAQTGSLTCRLADLHGDRRAEAGLRLSASGGHGFVGDGPACRLADDESIGRREECSNDRWGSGGDRPEGFAAGSINGRGDRRPRPTDGFWRDADWLSCRDGKWRPVEPGTFPLAHGAPARVGRLRGYGNAIVAPLAAEFLGTVLDVLDAVAA